MVVLEPARAVTDPAWSLHQIDDELADAVGAAKLDLELQLDERPDGELVGRLIYDRSLWDRSTAIRIAEHWAQLLGSAAADPARPISQLEMLTPAELRRQLVEWNAEETTVVTAGEGPTAAAPSIRDRVRERAAQQPQAPAITSGGRHDQLRRTRRGRGDRRRRRRAARPPRARWRGGRGRFGDRSRRGTGDRPVRRSARAAVDGRARADRVAVDRADRRGQRDHRPGRRRPPTGRSVSRFISAEGISVLHAGPAEWQHLIETGLRPARGLRALSGGAEPLSRELADAILARCRTLWNAFADPAIPGYCTLGRVERGEPVTIGRPLANVSVYVVDAHDRPVPVGVTGELLIAGTAAGSEATTVPATARRTGAAVRWLADGRLELIARRQPSAEGHPRDGDDGTVAAGVTYDGRCDPWLVHETVGSRQQLVNSRSASGKAPEWSRTVGSDGHWQSIAQSSCYSVVAVPAMRIGEPGDPASWPEVSSGSGLQHLHGGRGGATTLSISGQSRFAVEYHCSKRLAEHAISAQSQWRPDAGVDPVDATARRARRRHASNVDSVRASTSFRSRTVLTARRSNGSVPRSDLSVIASDDPIRLIAANSANARCRAGESRVLVRRPPETLASCVGTRAGCRYEYSSAGDGARVDLMLPRRRRLNPSMPVADGRRQGDDRNRTGVDGFAGRCVATPPRRRGPEG